MRFANGTRYFGTIDYKSLKTRVIPPKLELIDIILWTLQAEHKNKCGSLRKRILFSKKSQYSCNSPMEHDILGTIEDISLKPRVIPSKLFSIYSIRWTLRADHKNMWVSLRNSLLFSKKRRFSCISPTNHNIFGTIDDNSLKTRVIHSKLVSIDSSRGTLQAEQKTSVFLWEIAFYSRRTLNFREFRQRNTIFCVRSIITLWKLVLFPQN